MLNITKIFYFEMAHRLKGYDGACRNIHGHSYELHVTVTGLPLIDENDPKNGMIVDFGILKSIVNRCIIDKYDHALVVNKYDDELSILKDKDTKLVIFDGQPTSELMIIDFARELELQMPKGVSLKSLKLFETRTSFVEWIKEM